MYKKVIYGLFIFAIGLVKAGLGTRQIEDFNQDRRERREEALKKYVEDNPFTILQEMQKEAADIQLSEFQSYEKTQTELENVLKNSTKADQLKNLKKIIYAQITEDMYYNFTLKIQDVYFECRFVKLYIESSYGRKRNHSLSFFIITKAYIPTNIDLIKVMKTLIVVIRYMINTEMPGETEDTMNLLLRVLELQAKKANKAELTQIQENLQNAYNQIKETKEFKILTKYAYAAIDLVNLGGTKAVQGAQYLASVVGIKPYQGSQ